MPQIFPQTRTTILQDNVVFARFLPEPELARLREVTADLIDRLSWEGCAGLAITEEIRVTIAGQAAMLLLGLGDFRFNNLNTILVYPGSFLPQVSDELGEDEFASPHLGQAHEGGPVILSWWEVRWNGRRLERENLVLHEFAHKIAELGDPEEGLPPLADRTQRRRWTQVLDQEYERLQEDEAYQRNSLLDPYGASSRAEFFAVATETFFTKGRALRYRHADLYQLLAEWYHQDPASWAISRGVRRHMRAEKEEHARHVLSECNALLRRSPEHLDALRTRADCHACLGDFKRALADSTQILHLVPREDKADALLERGLLWMEMGKLDRSIQDLTQAIKRGGEFVQAYCARGMAHAARKEYDLALADLDFALEVDPNDDRAYRDRARVFREQNDPNRALGDLTRAIECAPHVIEGYVERAAVLRDLKRFKEARRDCDVALNLDPDQIEAYRIRAEVLESEGNQELAEQDRKQVAELEAEERENA